MPVDEIERFCKNCGFLRVIRYRPLASEYGGDVRAAMLDSQISDAESPAVWYVMLRAVDMFYAAHKRYPGRLRW